jgi:hypothetical protein
MVLQRKINRLLKQKTVDMALFAEPAAACGKPALRFVFRCLRRSAGEHMFCEVVND